MYKFLNIFILILIIFVFYKIFNYYSSSRNINLKNNNNSSIYQTLKDKIPNLIILNSDTDNVIEFNDSAENDINDNKKRSFWNLLNKWDRKH